MQLGITALGLECAPAAGLESWCAAVDEARGRLSVAVVDQDATPALGVAMVAVLRLTWPAGAQSAAPRQLLWELDTRVEGPRTMPWAQAPQAARRGLLLEDDAALWVEEIEGALVRARGVLDEQIALVGAPAARFPEALRSASPEVRLFAVREAERRRLAGLGPALVPLLETQDHIQLLAVVGTLASLGEHEAAPAVLERLPLQATGLLLAAIPALARFHHPEIDAFLEVLASGHASPDVQEKARVFLQRRAQGEARR